MEKNHYFLGFEKRNSGAFEHSWTLAKELEIRGYNLTFLANWFNSPVKKVDLSSGIETLVDFSTFDKKEGIFHLQTHTWEYNNLLGEIVKNPSSKLIIYLHAVIPYFYMSRENQKFFLEGNFSQDEVNSFIEQNLSSREKAQLGAILKSDHLITISHNHKKALENLNFKKDITVLENVTNFLDLDEEILWKSDIKSKKLKNFLGSENVLLYCGNLYKGKGADFLFDSFKMIKSEYPSSSLIILGVGESERQRLERYGLEKSFSKDIHLFDWMDWNGENTSEFLKYYFAADVLIQPVITPELYPRTVVDAMALGIPSITCSSPYTIGSSGSSEEIFNSFKYFKENPVEISKITKFAKEKIRKENTWDYYISNLEKIFRTLV